MTKSLPIIYLSSWADGDDRALADVSARIGAACRDVGFFYVVNHGVGDDLMNEAFAQSKAFFALPFVEKQAIAIEKIGGNRGYSGLMHEALDPKQGPDMKEAFNVGLDLKPDDPELLAGKPFRALNAWPDLPGFREMLLAYFGASASLGARIHRAFSYDLGVAPDYFAEKFDRPMATLRLLHYPAAASGGEERIGAGAHTDYGNLTLLATDNVGGLEVRTRGKMDRGARHARRLRRQHRRLPHAMDERRLRLHAAPGRQPKRPRALFHRLLLRPQSRSRSRRHPVLRRRRRARPLRTDPRRRLPQVSPRREQAGGSLSWGWGKAQAPLAFQRRFRRPLSHSAGRQSATEYGYFRLPVHRPRPV
jgi:hypothetical protein